MTPEAFGIAEKLSTMGGTALMLFLATYYLARTLKSEYDERIKALEKRSEECEQHRLQLGKEIRAIQDNRIGILERLLEEREGE